MAIKISYMAVGYNIHYILCYKK